MYMGSVVCVCVQYVCNPTCLVRKFIEGHTKSALVIGDTYYQ